MASSISSGVKFDPKYELLFLLKSWIEGRFLLRRWRLAISTASAMEGGDEDRFLRAERGRNA